MRADVKLYALDDTLAMISHNSRKGADAWKCRRIRQRTCLRVIVDQVASLTDTSALAWHARLCG